MKPLHIVAAALVMALWGGNFGFAKWGLEELPPLTLMALRFALVALMLVPFTRPPAGRLPWIVAISFTLGGLHFSLMFSGLSRIDASLAAIAIQLQVPFAAILAALFFDDRLGWRRMAGMVGAFVGIVIIAGEPKVQGDPTALAMIIGASAMWAISNVLIKKMGPVDGFALNGWMALFAVPQLVLASLLLETGQIDALMHAGWKSLVSIVYQAVLVMVVGYGVWYVLIRQYAVNQTMPFTLLVPLFGVLAGIVMLGEELTWRVVVGGAATIAGVGVIVLRRPDAVDRTKAGSAT